ncbi:MAG: hypothetical protein AVDCRST_MAG89-2822 [uncultured Gemmatimonadetes bacterium]|uniref:Uncharacterized protein n=1 Tax=uncultured Gemmatimonadota bacterium TaxID=203437 RepID=A0A6J4LZ13_9BACT|nr:MAG: hypothetical protein AVDCRST_MAG89-2822 [uncultured Gemmatimonadota bacterium]
MVSYFPARRSSATMPRMKSSPSRAANASAGDRPSAPLSLLMSVT